MALGNPTLLVIMGLVLFVLAGLFVFVASSRRNTTAGAARGALAQVGFPIFALAAAFTWWLGHTSVAIALAVLAGAALAYRVAWFLRRTRRPRP